MDKTTWTQGPWEIYEDGQGEIGIVTSASSPIPGCYITYAFPNGDGNVEANARLIAAAPKMYAALEELIAIIEHNTISTPDKANTSWARAQAARSILTEARGG